MRKAIYIFFMATALVFGAGVPAFAAVKPLDPSVAMDAWRLLHKMEEQYGIPQGLLHAISLVETGGGMEGQMVPWPYAINVNTGSWKRGAAQDLSLHLSYLDNVGFKRFTLRAPSGKTYEGLSLVAAKAHLEKYAADLPYEVRGERFSRRFSGKWQAVFFVNRLLVSGHDNIDIGLMQVNWMYHGHHFADLAEAFEPYHNVNYAVSYLMRHREKYDWWGSVGRYHSGTKVHADRYIKGVWGMYQKVHRIMPTSG